MSVPSTPEPQKIPLSQFTRRLFFRWVRRGTIQLVPTPVGIVPSHALPNKQICHSEGIRRGCPKNLNFNPFDHLMFGRLSRAMENCLFNPQRRVVASP
jgi:hypothetical protein